MVLGWKANRAAQGRVGVAIDADGFALVHLMDGLSLEEFGAGTARGTPTAVASIWPRLYWVFSYDATRTVLVVHGRVELNSAYKLAEEPHVVTIQMQQDLLAVPIRDIVAWALVL